MEVEKAVPPPGETAQPARRRLLQGLAPLDSVSSAEQARGLSMLLLDGVCSQVMVALTAGAFLVAFALELGASNRTIGLIAAIGPLSQLVQVPSLLLVEARRRRKSLVLASLLVSRVAWVAIIAVPWVVAPGARLATLLVLLALVNGFGALASPGYNSWKRDLIPERIMGRYLARRLATGSLLAAVLSLAAGAGIDAWQEAGQKPILAYALVFLAGSAAGIMGLLFLSRVPEPRMTGDGRQALLGLLLSPFRNAHQRRLLTFLGSWNFAVNFAAPFFTVYLLQRLHLRMTDITALAVLSQLVNVLFLRVWGRLADRYGNKSILSVSGPLFVVSILLWPFTTLPDRWVMSMPLLVVIHAMAGMSTAGVMIGASNITLRAAPRGQATAFIATNALVCGLMATLAPLLGGITADFFASRELGLTLLWHTGVEGARSLSVPAFDLRGLDFVFVIAFLLGLYAIHRLLAVREDGEVGERVVIGELLLEMRRAVSTVAGLRRLTDLSLGWLRERPEEPAGRTGDSREGTAEATGAPGVSAPRP